MIPATLTHPVARVAYHEAGHAAVVHALGLRIESVVIQLADALGENYTLLADEGAPDRHTAIKLLLGGGLAEQRAGLPREENSLSACDFFCALGEAIEASGGKGTPGVATAAEQLLDQHRAEVRELLDRPDVWAGVERLAAELLTAGTIPGDQVHKLLAGS